jgi:hypothetical protein
MKKNTAILIFSVFLPICVEDCQGMVPERESFDFMTPLGAFIDWSCNQKEGVAVASTWAGFVSMFKSDNYGGQGCIDGVSAANIFMYILREYFEYFQADGSYSPCECKESGILSLYPAFAEAFGNTDDPSKQECYCVAAKESGRDSSYRRAADMLNGIGEDFTLNCDGGVGNTRKMNAFLQLLLLTEIAETGAYMCNRPGYTYQIVTKFYKLMSVITE